MANKQILELTEDTTPVGADAVETQKSGGGDGSSRYVTLANLAQALSFQYGAMTDDSGNTVTVSLANTWYEVTDGFITGQVNGVTFGGNHYLAVSKAGHYLVTVNASITVAGPSESVGIAPAVNGTAQTVGHAHATTKNANDVEQMSTTTILNLAASDQVSLAVVNHNAVDDIVIHHASVTVLMIGA